jgi:hypothetical protein
MVLTEADKAGALCSRCESLGLYDHSVLEAAEIPVASLQMDCAFCTLILRFANSCSDASQTERLDDDGLLHRPERSNQNVALALRLAIRFSEHPQGTEHRNLWYLPIITVSYASWILRLIPVMDTEIDMRGGGLFVNPERADLSRAKQWIRDCQKGHGSLTDSCVSSTERLQITMKIIDCRTRRVRVAESGEPYVCLSYVWGGSASAQTPCGSQLTNIPKTIADAMFVALKIGIPQLRVDQ